MKGIRKEKVLKDQRNRKWRSHMHCVSSSLSSACLSLQSYEDVPLALRDSFALELKTTEQ